MQLSVEILDHIFSFLSHHETLFACSKDPILSPIIERHLYYNVVVQTGGAPNSRAFGPDQFSKLVSENPRILYYVRILKIQIEPLLDMNDTLGARKQWNNFTDTLLKFPILECIMLTIYEPYMWYWSNTLWDALEDRLDLPTLTELHLLCSKGFPSSLLDKCKNIKHLSLSAVASFEIAEGQASDPTLPRLKSLTLLTHPASSLQAWLKRHISELQSLKCVGLRIEVLPELLGACSATLASLELNFFGSQCSSTYQFATGGIQLKHFPEIPLIPKNLQQLVIHTEANIDEEATYCMSCLPAVAEAVNSFIPSLQHLVLNVRIDICSFSDFTKIDFSPLGVLGFIPRTDLYVYTGIAPAALTRAQLISLLGDDEGVMRSIEEGRLVIHSEKTLAQDHSDRQ